MTRLRFRFFAPGKPLWWLGLGWSLAIGAACYTGTSRSIEHEASERFEHFARAAQYDIDASIKAYTDLLRATASYFQAGNEVTREGFHRFIQGLDLSRNYPALDNINFAEYFADARRPQVEARQRAMPGYDYPPFVIRPAGTRPEYAVLTLIEPLSKFADRYGLDIGTRPAVGPLLRAGRDQGTLTGSGRPIQLPGPAPSIGMAIRLPIYRHDLPHGTVKERRAACLGSVGLGFNVARLVDAAHANLPLREMQVRLYTSRAGQRDELLYDSQRGRPAPDAAGQFSVTLPLHFQDHTWLAYFSADKSALYSRHDAWLPHAAAGVGFGASILVYALFLTLASSRRRALRLARTMTRELRDSQSRLQLSHSRLRRLAAHADQIKEEERKRIAREIHDDLGQNLLALRIEADLLTSRTACRHPRLHARASATLHQIDHTIRSVRHIINDLRPNVLDLGLSAAIEWQIVQFRQRADIVCEYHDEGLADQGVDDHCATAFFRVLQESLSNIQRHARATHVCVALRQSCGVLHMSIRDNGVGLREQDRNRVGSFGLVGIEERISLLGGHCALASAPGEGTTISITVPLGTQSAGAPKTANVVAA